jgi:hypothetical protein
MHSTTRYAITITGPGGDAVEIIGRGPDPRSPASVETRAHGSRAADLLSEIRHEVIYPPQDMIWALHSPNDLYGWHAAAGAVIDRRKGESWTIDHNLP